MPTLKIGALAERTGTNPPTIRYYEEIGLMRPTTRQEGGQRTYGEEHVRLLTLIRRCRDLGFPIDQVRSLVALAQDRDRSCTEARALAREHLEAVRAKLIELKALERNIAHFVACCQTLRRWSRSRLCHSPGPVANVRKEPCGEAHRPS